MPALHAECVFTQIYFSESDVAPDYMVPKIAEDATGEEIEKALSLEVCPRLTCRLTAAAMASLAIDTAVAITHATIANQVPRDCAWHDVPHAEPPGVDNL